MLAFRPPRKRRRDFLTLAPFFVFDRLFTPQPGARGRRRWTLRLCDYHLELDLELHARAASRLFGLD